MNVGTEGTVSLTVVRFSYAYYQAWIRLFLFLLADSVCSFPRCSNGASRLLAARAQPPVRAVA